MANTALPALVAGGGAACLPPGAGGADPAAAPSPAGQRSRAHASHRAVRYDPPQHLTALRERLYALPIASQLLPCANHGRDLLLFLQLLPDLLGRRCQLVLKLHTKRSGHVQPGSLTRVADGSALQQQLAAAGEEPCLQAPEPFLWPVEVSMGPSAGRLVALLAEQGLPLSALLGRRFPAGSMFACNHAALERLQGLIVPG